VQVTDHLYLIENASRAFPDGVRKSMREIRQVIGSATINPDLLTCAKRHQYKGYLRSSLAVATPAVAARDGKSQASASDAVPALLRDGAGTSPKTRLT
jgi:hypothetical protein